MPPSAPALSATRVTHCIDRSSSGRHERYCRSRVRSQCHGPRSHPLTIGALAAAADVNVETIRYYQRRGLLRQPNKPGGSIRRYGEDELARLKFVTAAQRLGFSLDEIAGFLTLEDGTHCREARELARHKLGDVREKLAHLRGIESALAGLAQECGRSRGKVSCPLIVALHRP